MFNLDPVTTSTIKLTIVETYKTKSKANNGARMVRFLPADGRVVSVASITPCEDAGYLPLTQAECEVAAGHVQLPHGKVVGRGGSNTVGYFGSAPQVHTLLRATCRSERDLACVAARCSALTWCSGT